jgi:hypothetical protein
LPSVSHHRILDEPSPGFPSASERPSPRSRGAPIRAIYTAIRDAVRASHANRNALAILVALNLYTIVVAIYQHWPPQNVFLLYWLQSLVIGVFQTWKLIFWKNISFVDDGDGSSTIRMTATTGKTAKTVELGRTGRVIFFIVGYFGVHAMMLKTYDIVFDLANTDVFTTFAAVRFTFGLLVLNHFVSFILNYQRDSEVPTTYGEIFGNTFIRILPLHLWPAYFMVIFVPTAMLLFIAYLAGVNEQILSRITSVIPTVAVVFFMVLKTVFEIPAHLVMHSQVKVIGRTAPT